MASMSLVAVDLPPGLGVRTLGRPSSWPGRHRRRHAAVASFDECVMSTPENVLVKLQVVELKVLRLVQQSAVVEVAKTSTGSHRR